MTQSTADISRMASRNIFLDTVKGFLKTKGWQQHRLGTANGPCCLGGAFVYVGKHRLNAAQYGDAERAIQNLVYTEVGYTDYIAWNDRPERTVEDIYDLLEKAKAEPLRTQYDNSDY